MGAPEASRLALVKGERGFAEFILVIYLVFFLTMMAFVMGIGLSLWRQAQAEYQWAYEALAFAGAAVNETGDVEEVMLNEGLARQYFEAAMRGMGADYELAEFRAVRPGQPVPGGAAEAPGYLAKIVVPVNAGNVPLIGPQTVRVPMTVYAVVTSREF